MTWRTRLNEAGVTQGLDRWQGVNETVVVVKSLTRSPYVFLGLALCLIPTAALAFDVPIDQPVPAAERRSGFTAGVSPSFHLGQARGYPNEVDKIDNPDFAANTHLATGIGATLWLGGALRDWFTFGLGFSSFSLGGNDLKGRGFSFLLRTEAFPLASVGNAWGDLGIFADWGAGSVGLKRNDVDVADGGSMGMIGVGVAHETLRLGHFAFGPSVEYHTGFSATMKLHAVSFGIRAAFYGGP